MFEKEWEAYAKSWSLPTENRDTSLADIVTKDVIYTDPNAEVTGRDAFSTHMAQFQRDVPGAYFEIIDVKGHHNQTLAKWRLCGKDGNEMMLGTSFANLSGDGKFSSFTGFF